MLSTLLSPRAVAAGLCELSQNPDSPHLLLPSEGNVHVYDALNLSGRPSVIKAHNNPLADMALSQDGNLMATSSEKVCCLGGALSLPVGQKAGGEEGGMDGEREVWGRG